MFSKEKLPIKIGHFNRIEVKNMQRFQLELCEYFKNFTAYSTHANQQYIHWA